MPGSVSLAQGIPSFNTPQVIRDFVIEKIQAGAVDKYSLTTGLQELREEIAEQLRIDGLSYDPDGEILVTVGAIEAITATLLACVTPGSEVILTSPSYVSYQGAIAIAGATPVFVPLAEDRNFDFDVSAMERAITARTKAILVCIPNNPTGTTYSRQATEGVLALANKHSLTLISDEVYRDFYYTNETHISPASLPNSRENCVRVCSFSKAYAMTGWRVGFVHADRKKIREMTRYHDAMVTCAPVVSQYGALAALRLGKPYIDSFRAEYRTRRDLILRRLDALSDLIDVQIPKAAYFVFPRLKDSIPRARDSISFCYHLLEKTGLALVPGVAFGPSGEGHVRISFGREIADIEEGMNRFESYLRNTPRPTPTAHTHVKRTQGFVVQKIVSTLQQCAQHRVNRSTSKKIVLAGIRGKTTIKRMIIRAFGAHKNIFATPLSYNTTRGLPLGILGLQAPKNVSEWLKLIPKAARSTLQPIESEILLLEFGFSTVEDAEKLLAIVRPDILLITDSEQTEVNQEFFDALKLVAQSSGQILVAPSDTTTLKLLERESTSQESSVVSASLASITTTNTGTSIQRGLELTALLAAALGLSPSEAVQRAAE